MEYEIKVTKLTHDDLVELFSTALYGCDFFGGDYNKKFYDELPKEKKQGECFEDKVADVLLNGGTIKIVDYNAEGEVYSQAGMQSYTNKEGDGIYEVRLEHILNACSTQEGGELAKELLIDEQGDYYTANNLLQIIVFGEVVYG